MNQTIDRDRQYQLEQWYFAFRHVPAWLIKIDEFFGLVQGDVHYLEELEDVFMRSNIKHDQWMIKERDQLPLGDTEEETIKILSKSIAEAYKHYGAMYQAGLPLADCQLILALRDVSGMEKLRNKIRARLIHKEYPEFVKFSEYEINIARQYPLEKLVELEKNNTMICPFHDDNNPSMWVKNGFGYCFSCGVSVDSIGWLMKVENMSFVDAVRRLQ